MNISKLFLLVNLIWFFAFSIRSEFILINNDDKRDFSALDESTKEEMKKIFLEVLLVYQWPMITMYFDQLPYSEQDKYIKYVQEKNGLLEFVREKIKEKYGNKYSIIFIPNVFFEVAYIHDNINNSNKISYEGDLRDKSYVENKFKNEHEEKIKKSIEQYYQENKNMSLITINSFDFFNKKEEIIKGYFRIVDTIKNDIIKNNILDEILVKQLFNNKINIIDNLYNSKNILNQVYDLELSLFSDNQFLLFRGSDGIDIDGDYVIDLPYREGKQKLIIDKAEVKSRDKSTFTLSSLSYGNSVLIGYYNDTGDVGANPLTYMVNKNIAYALSFAIKDYLQPTSNFSLRNKYFISPFYSIVSLLAKGEYFHSRSKISMLSENPYSSWNGKTEGLADRYSHKGTEDTVLERDIRSGANIFTNSSNSWQELAGQIAKDIAERIIFLKNKTKFNDEELKLSQKTLSEKLIDNTLIIGSNPINDIDFQEKNSYDNNNIFAKILANVSNKDYHNISFPYVFKWKDNDKDMSNTLRYISHHSVAFDDIRKRTKEHILIIPKGSYISINRFTQQASLDEKLDFFRTMAKVAESAKLVDNGYRIITNSAMFPGEDNHNGYYNEANQEVPHFHMHLAGGECLDRSVKTDSMNLPHGFDFDNAPSLFIKRALKNKLYEKVSDDKSYRLIAYPIANPLKDGDLMRIGIIMLTNENTSLYDSLHTFLSQANKEQINDILQFIANLSRTITTGNGLPLSLEQTGFRIIANQGHDAWHFPKNIFWLELVGGGKMPPTVSNVYENMNKSSINVDFDYLPSPDYSHDHCLTSRLDIYNYINKEDHIKDKYKKYADEYFIKVDSIFSVLNKYSYNITDEIKTRIEKDKKTLKEGYKIYENWLVNFNKNNATEEENKKFLEIYNKYKEMAGIYKQYDHEYNKDYNKINILLSNNNLNIFYILSSKDSKLADKVAYLKNYQHNQNMQIIFRDDKIEGLTGINDCRQKVDGQESNVDWYDRLLKECIFPNLQSRLNKIYEIDDKGPIPMDIYIIEPDSYDNKLGNNNVLDYFNKYYANFKAISY